MDASDTFHHMSDSIFDIARGLSSFDFRGKALCKAPFPNHIDQLEHLVVVDTVVISNPGIDLRLSRLAPFFFVERVENVSCEPVFVQICLKSADVRKRRLDPTLLLMASAAR